MQGQVKWYSKEKGFGFITGDDKTDVFVHKSDVKHLELMEGDRVEFELGDAPKGKKATKIVKL